MNEISRHSGVYVIKPDRTIVCHERLPAEERYNLERLRHQTIIHNGKPPNSLWIGRAHGNEWQSADLQEEINAGLEFSRVEAWVTHELATETNTREYIAPINGHHNNVPGRVIRLENGSLAKVVDLNRQYEMPLALATDWESILGNIAYGPARLPLQLVQDNPSVKAVISIHEDVDHSNYPYPFARFLPRIRKQDGFYLYDIKAYANEPRDRMIDVQMDRLRKELKARGFSLFSGIDDDTDPHLGNKVTNGLARQAVYDSGGHPHLDNTLELFLVYLRTLGLTNVERAFIAEVPGKIPKNKKKELLQIATDTFFLPVLGEMGAL